MDLETLVGSTGFARRAEGLPLVRSRDPRVRVWDFSQNGGSDSDMGCPPKGSDPTLRLLEKEGQPFWDTTRMRGLQN